MSMDAFSCLLALGDIVAIAILSASMRNDMPKVLDVSFAAVRCLTIFLTVFCCAGNSRWRLFSALLVVLCVGPAFVGFNDQGDSHAKLDFLVSLGFAIVEGFLLALTYSLSVSPVVAAENNGDLRESLLEEGRHGEQKSSTEEVFVDSYKGQGASFRRLVSLAYPERHILALATLSLFISSAASVVTPALFGRLIETISVTKDEHELNKTTLLLILMFVITSIFSLVRGALYTLAGERLVARFRVRLFDAIVHQDIEFFDRNQSGELQSRLSSDTASIQNAVTVNVSMALRWVLQVLVSLAIILIISWKLTLVMLAVVPAVGFGARIYGTFVRDISKRYQDALAKASETAEEAMGNIRTVRSFSKEGYEVGRYKARVQVSFEEGKRRAWAYGVFIGVIGLLGYLAVALVLWRGGMMVIRGTDGLSSADLTSFLLYTLNLAVSLGGLSELYSTLISAMGASERMFKILDTDPTINSKEDAQTLALLQKRNITLGSSLEFRNVEFHYPTRQDVKVLKGISFKCAAGTVNAFCGASGQGKSTIISLTQRYYDPTAGDILVNDQNIKDMHPVFLRSKMAVVSQEPTLFACSIAENIAYGLNRPCTQEEIIVAAKKANAYDFITSFKPGGFDTLVGERGVQLSGGQKQRVAIARAILANPEILLLDEATSALDSESEYLVQMALEQLMQDRTTIIVAHRLSTVRHADCIFVVDNGTIAEQGTYDQLIETGGIFSSLVARQLNRNSAT